MLSTLIFLLTIIGAARCQECTCEDPFVTATFNTYQIVGALFDDERFDATLDYFQNNLPNLDALCVQELWDRENLEEFAGALRERFPFSITAPSFDEGCPPGCTAERCKENDCDFAFDDNPDVALLSVLPFSETGWTLFDESPLWPIVLLYGKVFSPELQRNVSLFCSHYSASVPLLDLSDENEAQASQTVAFVSGRLQPGEIGLLLGDLNTGPGVGENKAVFEDSYNTLIDSGFSNLYLDAGQTACTRCSENDLNVGVDNTLIDHVLIWDAPSDICVASADRFAMEEIVEVFELGDVPLSDHYGVQASLCAETKAS